MGAVGKKRVLVLILCSALAGCGGATDQKTHHEKDPLANIQQTYAGSYPIQVVGTTGMVADVVKNVGGDRVKVDQLIPGDPHLFKASLEDISLLRKADAVFYSGLHLEGKMAEVLEKLAGKQVVLAVADFVDPEKILEDENKAPDPHIWFDVGLWAQTATGVGKALAKFDPKNAADYTQRAREYRAKLDKLHDEVKEKIATIPPKQRVLVTSHDAFSYFGRAYEIEVNSILGKSTDSEASVKKINDLVEYIKKRGVKAVFVESSVPERAMNAVIEGCRRQNVKLGGTLFSDAMGIPGTPEGTYEGMIRHNVETIVKALK